MYPTVAIETYGVGLSLVDLMQVDGWKGTVEEGLDGEGLGGFDEHRRHALAACKS
jgi:hypothetical protein